MYLYGASGHAKVILELLEEGDVQITGVFDDNTAITAIWDYQVRPYEKGDACSPMIISIGSNKIRKKVASEHSTATFAKAIHPKAIISRRALIGDGSVVMGGVTVNADVTIGRHCIINTNSSVDHDCVIHNYVHLSPNVVLCGNVAVGEGTHIGAGAVVIPGIKIGKWAVIGAGAVVIRDVEDGAVVAGNPAKVIKINSIENI